MDEERRKQEKERGNKDCLEKRKEIMGGGCKEK